jgi:hypothetical protein
MRASQSCAARGRFDAQAGACPKAAAYTSRPMPTRPLNVLCLIDHVCWDGSLHGGGRLFYNLLPEFDPQRVRVFPYFLRASDDVRRCLPTRRFP